MGLLTRAGNLIGDIGRSVPAGSKRDRVLGALAGGVEGTQNLLAGKYAQDLQNALSPANTAQYAPLAYGLIGAGGSVAGNMLSGEEKDPGRILAEAAGAGALSALAGRTIGGIGELRQAYIPGYKAEMQGLNDTVAQYQKRANLAGQAGAASTQAAARQRVADTVNALAAKEKEFNTATRVGRAYQGLHMAAVPALAGLGGMVGGGVSNLAQSVGIPGFNQDVIMDPESPGSSNTMGARLSTPTLRYVS